MKNKRITISILSLILVLSVGFVACSSPGESGSSKTLVIGNSQFNGVFSPFFATTAYDREVSTLTNAFVISNDPDGKPIDGAATYKPPVEVKNNSGEVEKSIYTFELKDGVKFSDGTVVTADDLIFTYKVYLDPTYSGSATLKTVPIVGVNEYFYDDPNYKVEIDKITLESKVVSTEEIEKYIVSTIEKTYSEKGQDVVIKESDYKNEKNLTGDDLKNDIIQSYSKKLLTNSLEKYKELAIKEKYKTLEKDYISKRLSAGDIKVPEIEGIKKINDKTVEVTILGVDPSAIWKLGGVAISPKNYYGVGKKGGSNEGKEFKKGDLTVVNEKSNSPQGAGPYKFLKYENNVVSFEVNSDYFLGEPKIKKLKIQVVDTANKLNSVKSGNVDISDPAANPETLKQATDAGLDKELIDNLGYGYIGINADRVTDVNVRKGLMHLMNRGPAVESYYGELATVIERPMSIVSWAYPDDVKAFYDFSTQKALEYFQKAGYVQSEENGKKVLKKDNKQLRLEIGIPGEGKMDHPSGPIITQMKKELEQLGGVLDIQDVDANILFERLDAGQWDMWVAAWQSTIDPDMYQIYHSKGPSNHYRIRNDELDKLISDARSTNDIAVRKEKYTKALDIIMESAVEMPIYQRKNMYVYNPKVLSKNSIPGKISPFYYPFGYSFNEVQNLELVK